jgi:hypothetical protein
MEYEGLLRSSQDPSTSPYPEPAESSPYHRIKSMFHVPNLISIFLGLGCLSKDSKTRPCVIFRNRFYNEELLAQFRSHKQDHHPLSAVPDFLFNVLAATFRIWRISPFEPQGRAMPWRQGTHLTST